MQRYEIFQKQPSRQPSWVETAASLDDALIRVKELTQMSPGDYFILDCQNSICIMPFDMREKRLQDLLFWTDH